MTWSVVQQGDDRESDYVLVQPKPSRLGTDHVRGSAATHFIRIRTSQKPMPTVRLSNAPDMKIGDLHRLQRQYWTAFKHALNLQRKERDDEALLQRFTDEKNDHAVFIGWWDYAQTANKMPIEAQALHVWYLAKYPEKLALHRHFSWVERTEPR